MTPPKIDPSLHTWPHFDDGDIEAIAGVLASGKVNYWTGNQGRLFEEEFASQFGVARAVAMANGTVTLQACLRALNVGSGDEVVTTPRTFIGTSSAIVMEGARPVFADVDPSSGNVTAETIERALTPKTRAILPVHLYGWPCDMPAIMALAEERGLKVIEDCAQSHGARIGDKHTGSFGDINSWSFCQDKIMTTGGEGGMIGTNDQELWEAAWSLKDHGKSFDAVYHREHPVGFRWLHERWGTNWRMTEMQSAIGRRQLGKLDEWSSARRRNAHIMEQALQSCAAVRVPEVPSGYTHAYYRVGAYVVDDALKSGWSRDRILSEFSERGVPGLSGSCSEIYLERCFTEFGMGQAERLPVAKLLGETSIVFLVHPTMSQEMTQNISSVVVDVLNQAVR